MVSADKKNAPRFGASGRLVEYLDRYKIIAPMIISAAIRLIDGNSGWPGPHVTVTVTNYPDMPLILIEGTIHYFSIISPPMPTKSPAFKKIILATLKKANGKAVPIEQFYVTAAANLDFDRHDQSSTVLRGVKTDEPAWKRNLRNTLQRMKTNGEVVNSSPSFWRSPSPDPGSYIIPEMAWKDVVAEAVKAKLDNSSWESPIEKQRYHVEHVDEERITIMRHSTGTVAWVKKNDVIRSVTSLNTAGGVLGRGAMLNTVAKESAVVHLHPSLKWDELRQFTMVNKASAITTSEKLAVMRALAEADDDKDVYQSFARKIRKGQPALRRKLLQVYGGCCCITGTGPENVLQAAHIEPHTTAGNNHSKNALLLRSDIHDLFDDGLIQINPDSLKIVVHPSLASTIYHTLTGSKLRERADQIQPDHIKLMSRWQNCLWKNSADNI